MRAIAEDHLIGRAEQQQPAGNLEDGMPIPELVQHRFPSSAITTKIEAAISGGRSGLGEAEHVSPGSRNAGTMAGGLT
ncbi:MULTISPECIES: hypothetical protein [unclassified Bradyrhizobium]|uniref:hypothetical protein n=1 Tax=unclassified Bradyrhizobium TaxID=2631580 RepID=UPI00359C989C